MATSKKRNRTFDDEKCNTAYEELVAVFQKHKLTVGEIIIAYGNLGYSLGASIGGFSGKGPSFDELNKLYYEHPERLDIAMMLNGVNVTNWFSSWQEMQLKNKNIEKEG